MAAPRQGEPGKIISYLNPEPSAHMPERLFLLQNGLYDQHTHYFSETAAYREAAQGLDALLDRGMRQKESGESRLVVDHHLADVGGRVDAAMITGLGPTSLVEGVPTPLRDTDTTGSFARRGSRGGPARTSSMSSTATAICSTNCSARTRARGGLAARSKTAPPCSDESSTASGRTAIRSIWR